MKKTKKYLTVVTILLIIIFITTVYIIDIVTDFYIKEYITIANGLALYFAILFVYIILLLYDIDAKRLLLSKILFYILLGTSIAIFVYYYCCDPWAGTFSLYFFFAATVHFLIMYIIKKFRLRTVLLSMKWESMILLAYIVFLLIFFFGLLKKYVFN